MLKTSSKLDESKKKPDIHLFSALLAISPGKDHSQFEQINFQVKHVLICLIIYLDKREREAKQNSTIDNNRPKRKRLT